MTYVDVVIQSDKFGPWAYRTNVDVQCKTKVEELAELEKAFWKSARNALEHLIDMHKDDMLKENDEPELLPAPPPNCKTQNEPTEKQIKFAKAISEQLGIPLPEVKTRQSLFIFIRDNRGRFDEMREDMESDWELDAGYGLQYGDVGADPWGVGE